MKCEKCGQIDKGQTGEYPCSKCGLPTTHDAPMTRAFQVGDRVRLKGYSCGGKRVDGRKGSVLGIDTGDDIEVSVDNSGDVIVTPSQCVRLVKRERRRVWVESHRVNEALATSFGVGATISGRYMCEGDVEFIEVLPKKERK